MSAHSESPADLILAVDAGGTKTAACLARTTGATTFDILGRGRAAGANPLSIGIEQAAANIVAAAAEAAREAKLFGTPVARAVLAVAGAADPAIASELVRRTSEANVARQITVVSDVLPILAAGGDSAGVALIAGTGSVAFGRDENCRTVRCGGWGHLLGDDGGGFAIGRAALRSALADLETSRQGCQQFTMMLLDELHAKSASELMAAIHAGSEPRAVIASLAHWVGRMAESGDPVARQILDEAARDLASLVMRVAQSLGLDLQTAPISVAGGVLVGSKYLRDGLSEQLSIAGIQAQIRTVADPLDGCLRLAAANSNGVDLPQ
jgi:N-acetylglucosamine kinase-like BadF-type ATPase